ncbi:MAG TPA: hypothetical protein VK765_06625 [Solirubrobacteraceae bacterium]|jgi:hypothetical protein|nr:hypothetical protein [Solirubrobacteraceae bacterium]
MRHGFAKLAVALTALICLSAAGAAIAQAAEGPRWKLAGKYLTAGETREMTTGSGDFTLKTPEFLGGTLTLTCTKQSYEKASIDGSSIGNAGTFKATEDLSGCTVTGNGGGSKCSVAGGGTIKTGPLEGRLAYSTKERTGKILMLFGKAGSSQTLWAVVKFEGASCAIDETEMKGSTVAEVVTSSTPDEVGKEAYAKVQELRFPTSQSADVWVEKEGKLEEEPVNLKFGGDRSVPSGASDLEAKTSEVFGASTRPTEDLGWNVQGAALKNEESRELAPGSGEFTLTHTSGIKITCTGQTYEKGSIEGSSSGNAGAIKVAHLNFSGCTVTGNGSGCSVSGGLIQTEALEGRLAYATKERTGKILVLLGNDGSSPTKWWALKFVGAGCTRSETELYGSVVAEVVTAGTPDEVAGEAEAKVQQLRFPTSEIEKVWVEREGKTVEERVGLQLSGTAVVPTGTSNLELKSGELFGAFTNV